MSRPARPPVVPDPRTVRTFRTSAAFEQWLRRHHARETDVWVRIYKKTSGVPSITPAEALDAVLCWGWIDGLRKRFDADSYLQRYSPRRPKSLWSQINRTHVERLIAAGRMTPHGQRQVDAARADGRWDAAYAPLRTMSIDAVPADVRAAIDANPRARRTLRSLDRQNLFALVFRANARRTPAGRARTIATLVARLERGETLVPERRR